jgi:hypothetical protein
MGDLIVDVAATASLWEAESAAVVVVFAVVVPAASLGVDALTTGENPILFRVEDKLGNESDLRPPPLPPKLLPLPCVTTGEASFNENVPLGDFFKVVDFFC